MRDVVVCVNGRVRRSRPALAAEPLGADSRQTDEAFELRRDLPGPLPLYYRVGPGRLEWSGDLADFRQDAPLPPPDPGALLAMALGAAPAPDSTPVPGVHRLAAGVTVRLDRFGVRVSRHRPETTTTRRAPVHAMSEVLASAPGPYAIAYSGGLSSAFLAVSALRAGHRPPLVHADFGTRSGTAPALIPGLRCERVPLDLLGLLDHHRITGEEPVPPLPDTEVPRLLAEHLAAHIGLPLMSGGLLDPLTSARLPDARPGYRGWRLLTCEPFHVSGVLGSLSQARALFDKGVVHDPDRVAADLPDSQPVSAPPPPSPTGADRVPGLTDRGREAFDAARRGSLAVWREHLESLPPVLGRADAALAEHGHGGAQLPALDPRVLASVGALPPHRLGRIRGGRFQSHVPLRTAVAAHRVTGVRKSTPRHWLRLAAAEHLHRERPKVIAEWERESALADLGLIDPAVLVGILRDGRDLSAQALVLLRMVWLDRWLRG
ncbi:hypothetical protein GKQ77_21445 [Streptomyces sp. BG9H]|uniref:Asparagine synthase n=1 Tax=Streptomyces anatolicus TaxID=2675858 RepID=A0ABS6YRP8_9ACTN|nr:hypothetical protein [Streptomyces anatolicus]MBW5424099.1 hypothetical protein [Streptomyces anatolicus]